MSNIVDLNENRARRDHNVYLYKADNTVQTDDSIVSIRFLNAYPIQVYVVFRYVKSKFNIYYNK